jgi:hypothetical protein
MTLIEEIKMPRIATNLNSLSLATIGMNDEIMIPLM